MKSKDFVCVIGPSGCGKSTYGQYIIDNLKIPVVVFNGDMERKILLQSYDPLTAEKLLSDKFNYLKNDAVYTGKHFAMESPLPMSDQINEFKIEGYSIKAIFFGLDSPAICNARISGRALLGGLDIPPESVINIYDYSFRNLIQELEKGTFDEIYFCENNKIIASFSKENNVLKIHMDDIVWFNRMIRTHIEMFINQQKMQ